MRQIKEMQEHTRSFPSRCPDEEKKNDRRNDKWPRQTMLISLFGQAAEGQMIEFPDRFEWPDNIVLRRFGCIIGGNAMLISPICGRKLYLEQSHRPGTAGAHCRADAAAPETKLGRSGAERSNFPIESGEFITHTSLSPRSRRRTVRASAASHSPRVPRPKKPGRRRVDRSFRRSAGDRSAFTCRGRAERSCRDNNKFA